MNAPHGPPGERIAPLHRRRMLTLVIASEGGILAVAVVLAWAVGQRFWEDLAPSLQHVTLHAAQGAALSLPMVAIAVFLAETSWRPFTQLHRDFDFVVALFRKCTVADLFLISLSAGVGEEALFRGVLQPLIGQHLGPAAGLIIVSVLFGFCHAISGIYIILATLMGLYLGGLYLWFDSLLVPIAVHAAYDFLALVYGVKIRRDPAD